MFDFESDETLSIEANEEQKRLAEVINKQIIGTFETELGQRCLENFKRAFIDRDIYVQGMTLDQVAFRQGEASVIKKIIKALEEAKHG